MPSEVNPAFESLLHHVSTTRGFDFTAYKRSTLRRRAQLRMQALNIETFEAYQDYLEVDPEEFTNLFNTLLINVTGFFRDPEAWALLEDSIIPQILADRGEIEPIRVWCAACATGEEAYSLAMLFANALGIGAAAERVKIYATDVDDDALATARAASYSAKQLVDVPERFRERFFEANGQQEMLSRDVRRMVIFGKHNLLSDAPISRVDLLSCRNALMYFNAESQARILERFFFALRENAFLFLGKAETLLARASEVTPVDLRLRIFQKTKSSQLRARLLVSAQDGQRRADPMSEDRIRETAWDIDLAAQLVVDLNGRLVLANEAARRQFGIREQDISRPLQDLQISYRPVELRSLIDRAIHEARAIVMKETQWPMGDGAVRWLDTHAMPLMDSGGLIGVKIVFVDVTAAKMLRSEIEASHSELETAYEELQSSNEELETTNEELHSTVEELETTNEELQSANEELETMNEELQSANEELQTLNEAMREHTTELDRSNAYRNAILQSLGMGVVVLNRNLEIQIWNPSAEDQWGLRANEVEGKHLLGLDIGLPVDRLVPTIRECLAGTVEAHIQLDAHNRRGRPVTCDVIGRPFSLSGDGPHGVILLIETTERAVDSEPR